MTTNTITYGREAVRNQGMRHATGLLGRFKGYFAKQAAARQLAQLDDRLLADIGVQRAEIHSMVWGK